MICVVLGACLGGEDEPVPTEIDPDQFATERAQQLTATAIMQMTLETLTPTLTATTLPPTETPTSRPTNTDTPTETLTPTITLTPSQTWTRIPEVIVTASPTITPTFTPSITPTRVANPDAVVGDAPTALRVEPNPDAVSVTELPSGSALAIVGRTDDDRWVQVRLLNGIGSGWVAAADLFIFVDIAAVPTLGASSGSSAASRSPLPEPPLVTDAVIGADTPVLDAYDFAVCGNTYWETSTRSMEDLAIGGRYPRFSTSPIKVYVHGILPLSIEERDTWELAISQAFAELSQAIRLERVYPDDLEFFSPWVDMETVLADRRVDMVWHLADAATYAQSAPCADDKACSVYGFSGLVAPGPAQFGGLVYLPADAEDKKVTLLQAVLPALGLWVQSDDARDITALDTDADRLSRRDIDTLRCLYNAPPFGDNLPPYPE